MNTLCPITSRAWAIASSGVALAGAAGDPLDEQFGHRVPAEEHLSLVREVAEEGALGQPARSAISITVVFS